MRSTRYLPALTFSLIAIVAGPVHADTITTYTINFATTSGAPTPASGSFTYDSTNPQFTNFIVQWDGFSFDLTSSANNPTPAIGSTRCPGSASSPAYGFELITKTIPTPCGPSYTWGADTPGPGAAFLFEVFTNTGGDAIVAVSHQLGVNPADASGIWTVSVPEPSSSILLGIGLLGLLGVIRKFRLG